LRASVQAMRCEGCLSARRTPSDRSGENGRHELRHVWQKGDRQFRLASDQLIEEDAELLAVEFTIDLPEKATHEELRRELQARGISRIRTAPILRSKTTWGDQLLRRFYLRRRRGVSSAPEIARTGRKAEQKRQRKQRRNTARRPSLALARTRIECDPLAMPTTVLLMLMPEVCAPDEFLKRDGFFAARRVPVTLRLSPFACVCFRVWRFPNCMIPAV
jgi:hypothetical protein